MFGGGVESLLAYEDYFMPCDAPRDAMLAECRFENHRFVAFSRLPLAIIYNPRLVSRPPAGFADLLDDGLRGQIAFANPAVSGSSFTVLATLMQALDDENALVRFADNVRGHELSGSGAVVSTVAAGEMRVGVALYETAKKRMLAGEHIAVIWPKEGTSAVPDGAAVLAGCAHEENAQSVHFVYPQRGCAAARGDRICP
ncbi:MAG: ABC transporter substrate-binding protein [Christensenellales bacterium]